MPENAPTGCILLLKDRTAWQVKGLSATTAKHLRRCKQSIEVTGKDGKKVMVRASDIQKIQSLPQP